MSTTKQIIGSVSSGTMREEDLIPRFLYVLESLTGKQDGIRADYASVLEAIETGGELSDDDEENANWLLNEVLFDALNNAALPYFYFGAHPGDGSDYGYWLSEDVQEQVKGGGGMVVSDLEDVPADFSGEVLHVNDHGNATLFCRDEGSEVWREIWSVV